MSAVQKIETGLIEANHFRAMLRSRADYAAQSEFIKATRQEILSVAEKKLRGEPYQGEKCAIALAAAHDCLIRELFLYITEEIFPRANPTKAETMALLAIGGYGAGRLAPFSDIDLLFLLPGKPSPWNEQCVEYMLKLLWDCGLKVGYSVRDIKNAINAVKMDMVFCTTMLDGRWLVGDHQLFIVWQKQFKRAKRAITAKRFVKAKLLERDLRHEKAGHSRYLVEPDIKNSKGGLRDLQTLWWLAKFCYDAYSGDDLLKAKLFDRAAYQNLCQSEAMLWNVRCHMHFLSGQAVERLSFPIQPTLANLLGFRGDGRLAAVELFMKSYFLVAKQAGDLTRILCAQLEEHQAKSRPRLALMIRRLAQPKNKALKVALSDGLLIDGGRLNIARLNLFAEKPILMMQFFHLAAAHDLNFHPDALNQIRKALDKITPALRKNKRANQLFLDILSSRKNPARILRVMNEAGLLGRFIPDFGRIVAQMQFNMYHHYTVDEHLLHAVGQISAMEQNGLDDIKIVRKVFAEINKTKGLRHALYTAIFTHDISKGQGSDHSELGAGVCQRLGKRFGLAPDHIAIATWLVEKHLLMSDVAQKRDLGDPKTIKNFVSEVKTADRLRLLFILTIADIRAVGPGTWNGWKAQLLETLYRFASLELKTPSYIQSAQLVRRQKKALAHTLHHWKQKNRRDYMKLHADSYWVSVDLATQKRHAALWRQWKEKTPSIFAARDIVASSVSEIILISQDHPGLFSRLVGAFTISGLHITDARIFTTHNGLAFDTFWVQTDKGTPIGKAHGRRLRQTIKEVLEGKILPPEEIKKRENLIPSETHVFEIKPEIYFDNEASEDHTVVEVDCLDSPYLLHALAQQIFHHGLSLSSAHIATFGERAVDVFYLKDRTGQKITDLEKQKKIQHALMQKCLRP